MSVSVLLLLGESAAMCADETNAVSKVWGWVMVVSLSSVAQSSSEENKRHHYPSVGWGGREGKEGVVQIRT